MWKLVIEDDEGKRTVVPLTRDDYTVGRREGNTIRLTERNVSRDHGRIRRKRVTNGAGPKDVFVLEDHSSYNGVFINGLRVAHTQDLQHGDLVQIGDYRIVLQDDAAAALETATIPISTEPDAKATIPMASQFRGQNLTERPRRFVMLVGPTPGVEYPLDRERMTIGRAEEANISVNHNSVSRLHCEVHALVDGRFEIVDKGSSNGVRVNGVELKRSIIEAGDVIELGDVRFKFVGAGQVFVPGPHESQQLTAISDRETEPVDPHRRGWGGYVLPVMGAGVVGALLILGLVYFLRQRTAEYTGVTATPAPPIDPDQALVLSAKEKCSLDDCEASHQQITTLLSVRSPWRESNEFRAIEATWADSLLRRAQTEGEPSSRKAFLQRIANTPTVDAARRSQANELLSKLDEPAPSPTQLPSAGAKDAGATITSAVVAPAQPRVKEPKEPIAHASAPGAVVAPPLGSATSPGASASAKTASAFEAAAKAASEGRIMEARAALEPKVRSGHATMEEVRIVREACKQQGDKLCKQEIDQKYPQFATPLR